MRLPHLDQLESESIHILREAAAESQKADLMLVLGTSLTVYPAASMPDYTLRNGGQIVIVNNMPTHLDRHAVRHFDELEPVFEGLKILLEKESTNCTNKSE